jgi:hypothetical protein
MKIDLLIAEMDRIKVFSFFHSESQAPVKFQHRLGVLNRNGNVIKALNRHCEPLSFKDEIIRIS